MKTHIFSVLFSSVICLLLVAGCASNPAVNDYPTRFIDRPATVPNGVTAWEWPGQLAVTKYGTGDNQSIVAFPPIPILWKIALGTSGNWELGLFGPIPLNVTHQLLFSKMNVVSWSLTAGVGYGSGSRGLIVSPNSEFFWRHKLTDDFALEFSPSLGFSFYSGGRAAESGLRLKVGLLLQVTDSFALRPYFAPAYGESDNLTTSITKEHFFHVPLGLGLLWNLGPQWDIQTNAYYSGIGRPKENYQYGLALVIVHRY